MVTNPIRHQNIKPVIRVSLKFLFQIHLICHFTKEDIIDIIHQFRTLFNARFDIKFHVDKEVDPKTGNDEDAVKPKCLKKKEFQNEKKRQP